MDVCTVLLFSFGFLMPLTVTPAEGLPQAAAGGGGTGGKGFGALAQLLMGGLRPGAKVDGSPGCNPPCKLGQCCLLRPGTASPSCHGLQLSGQECHWEHFTLTFPSRTDVIYGKSCPCHFQMRCNNAASTGLTFNGSCAGIS